LINEVVIKGSDGAVPIFVPQLSNGGSHNGSKVAANRLAETNKTIEIVRSLSELICDQAELVVIYALICSFFEADRLSRHVALGSPNTNLDSFGGFA